MSALFMDGFDQYGSADAAIGNMLDGVWAQFAGSYTVRAPTWGPARTGSSCLTLNGGSSGGTSFFRYVLPQAPPVLFASFGFSVDALPGTTNLIVFETETRVITLSTAFF